MNGKTVYNQKDGWLVLREEDITYTDRQDVVGSGDYILCTGGQTTIYDIDEDKESAIKMKLNVDPKWFTVYDLMAFENFELNCVQKYTVGEDTEIVEYQIPAMMPTPVPEGFPLEPADITDTRIKGERTFTESGVTLKLDFDYDITK